MNSFYKLKWDRSLLTAEEKIIMDSHITRGQEILLANTIRWACSSRHQYIQKIIAKDIDVFHRFKKYAFLILIILR